MRAIPAVSRFSAPFSRTVKDYGNGRSRRLASVTASRIGPAMIAL